MPTDELSLINMAQEGDLTAFNRLVPLYQDLAFSVAYRIMGNPQSAEDLVQDALIRAYTNLSSFRGGSFRAWLLRIVTNACYDELRYLKRRPTTPLEPLTEDDDSFDSPAWLADPGDSPEELAEQQELNDAIQLCLNQLPEDFRLVVVLVDIQGMDYSEASEITQKPLGTIKSRLARARQRLQHCLQGFWELLPPAFRLEEERYAI